MEKFMSSFEYEPLVLYPELETLDEEEKKGDIDGVGPSSIRVPKEPRDLRGGKDSPEREDVQQTFF
jgi:hypothetical protein